MQSKNPFSALSTRLLVVASAIFISVFSLSVNAAKECGDEDSGPLPDCVKVQYRGGGKINIDNQCDYDVDVKVDHSVEHDEVMTLKAHHQKMIVNRMVVRLFCCHATTPECPQGEETTD